MIWLIVDDLAGRARLDWLVGRLGDPSSASLNTSTFDGGRLDLTELQAVCEAMPFLSDRRLVIVRALLGRAGERSTAAQTQVAEYLERVPPTTDLVFLEPENPSPGPLVRAVERLVRERRAEIVREAPLDAASATSWVLEQAGAFGGIDPAAAVGLVDAVGADKRALLRELEKLSLLADGRRISVDDVRALVRAVDQGRIFELVDAIGSRNARAAVRAWRTLLRAGEDPHRLLAMIARQFRLLVQASELAGSGAAPAAAASALGLPPRVAAGLASQARSWSPGALEAVFGRIVALDEASKTGGPDLEGALEALVLELVAARR